MPLIPEQEKTTKNLVESRTFGGAGRPYLGMSGLGNECNRALWAGFRWLTKSEIPARVRRIFERGDLEEARIIRDLKAIGVECFRRAGYDGMKIPITGAVGEQQEEFMGFAGHAMGHPDGRAMNVPEAPKTEHLLEFKTCADRYFKKYTDSGVKVASPGYYAQLQRYMKAAKLKRALFIITNKNNEERHYERVKYDVDKANELVEREREIILTEFIPFKAFKSTHINCRYCNHRYFCHHGAMPEKTCRSCKFADLGNEGKWFCGFSKERELSVDEQRKACDCYKLGIYPE